MNRLGFLLFLIVVAAEAIVLEDCTPEPQESEEETTTELETTTTEANKKCCVFPFQNFHGLNKITPTPNDFNCSEPISYTCGGATGTQNAQVAFAGYFSGSNDPEIIYVNSNRAEGKVTCNTESHLWTSDQGEAKEYARFRCGYQNANGQWDFQ